MDKYQLVMIEIEVALSKVIKLGLDITTDYVKGPPKKKSKSKKKDETAIVAIDESMLDLFIDIPEEPEKPKKIKPKKEKDILMPSLGRDVPKDIALFEMQVSNFGSIDDLNNMKGQINEFALFLRRQLDDSNMVISYACREMHPYAAKLGSLIHIARAHPDDAIKRAKNLFNKKPK
jgi:hypothetical protein